MEIGVESSNGGKLSRRSRSVDLKSILKPNSLKRNDKVSVSEGKSLKRKISSDVEGETEKSRGKRSKKELPLSFLKTGGKNAKKSLAEVYSDEIGLGCGAAKDIGLDKQYVSGPGERSDGNEDDSGNGMLLGLEGGTIQIPKKRRGFVGRKKHDSQQSLKSASQSDRKCDFVDEEVKINCKTDSAVEMSDARVMEVNESDELDKKLISLRNTDQNDRIGHAVIDKVNIDSLPKKSHKKRRRKGVEQVGTDAKAVVEPLLDGSTKAADNSVEEDEKNLEENAAMMLSSRFDPSCTGFSLNSKASASPTTNRSLFQPHNSGQSDSAGGLDFVSPDMADRVLRPRSQHSSKSLCRKRRHFYEVIPEQFNGRRLLNKRIKVFWPLDESWYRGLINDYDDQRKLHHIKYDDRDEEWVDLCNEKFKILLFPSEFPNRSSRRTGLTDTESHTGKAEGKTRKEGRKKKLNTDDDNSASNNVDTMPIISWVTRTKSLSSRAGKKQKTSVSSLHSIVSLMSDNTCNSVLRVNDGTTKRASSKSQRGSVLPKGHSPGRKKTSLSSSSLREKKSSLSFKGDKLPIVYFRRHRKTNDTLCKHDRVSASSVGANEKERNRSFGTSLQKSDLKSSYRLLREILSELTILPTQPELCDLKLSVPVLPLLNHYLEDENDKLFRTLFLLRRGSLMMAWPKVRLEILLVDNLSELRFLLFEGTLEEAMAFCFLLLRVMDCGNGVENNEEEQLPMMSINLRFTRMQGIQTQFLFAAYRFVSLKQSKWMYIDSNLMTKCLIARRLSLSECSNGNVSVLQDCASKLPVQFVYGCLIKGLHSLKEPGISRETCNDSDIIIQLFRKLKIDGRKVPILAFPDSATVNISKTAGIKLLMDSIYSDIITMEHDTVETSKICSTGGNAGDFPDVQHAGHGFPSNNSFSKGNYGVIDCSWEATGRSFPNFVPRFPVSEFSKQIGESENSIVKSEKYPRHLPQSGRVQNGSHSFSNDTIGVKKLDRPHEKELSGVPDSSTLNGAVVPNSNPTAPRSMHVRRRTNSSYRSLSSMGLDVRDDTFRNGFVNGPKRPRTQVSYLLPYGSLDLSPKSRNSQNRIASHKRIRRLKEKDVPDVSKKDFDLLSCDANVLISQSDRGWRETGAVVVLELDNQNEWKMMVKISGAMQYSYKAHQFLQPGSTNRFTHAMMWRGGRDWVLEFTNRSQWTRFKEMHEECYNRSVRAASVKAIPIPGVRVIDENEDSGTEELFVRSSSKYLQQVESDVEMALNPSHVLYDMDSEDEQWILANCSLNAENNRPMEISDDIFERTMDAFEKASYTRQRDQFSSNEIEEFMAGVEPIEIVKSIHDFWWKKRQKKGMHLIRHLQPPSWERYQQKVKEWELAANKTSSSLFIDCQKVSATEKPPMFAFCMKPRGLEVPNKGSKQRSRRRFSVSGTAGFADQDGFHALGRRSSGNHFGNGKFIYPSNRGNFMGDFASPRLNSPRDVASPRYVSLGNDGYYNSRVSTKKPKRIGALISPRDPISYSQRDAGWKNGFKHWNSDWSDHRIYYLEGSKRSDIQKLNSVEADGFTVRDASGTARHAQKIARLKREKAERKFHRADRAVHKALAALMTAEAIKAASEDRNELNMIQKKEVGGNNP